MLPLLAVLLVLVPVDVRAQSELCQSQSPDQSLVDALTVCRGLNYPFCVMRAPGDQRTDLSALAVELDRELAARYQDLSPLQSQRCIHAWVNKVCSETFLPLATPSESPCAGVCTQLRDHCLGLECGDVGSGPGCHDFFAQTASSGAACLEAQDDPPPALSPNPPARVPTIPRPRRPFSGTGSGKIQFHEAAFALLGMALVHFVARII